jgi:hypothetical protein
MRDLRLLLDLRVRHGQLFDRRKTPLTRRFVVYHFSAV